MNSREPPSDVLALVSPVKEKWERELPPTYASTGDLAVDRLAFFHILERLKVIERVYRSVRPPQLILHSHRHKNEQDGSNHGYGLRFDVYAYSLHRGRRFLVPKGERMHGLQY